MLAVGHPNSRYNNSDGLFEKLKLCFKTDKGVKFTAEYHKKNISLFKNKNDNLIQELKQNANFLKKN